MECCSCQKHHSSIHPYNPSPPSIIPKPQIPQTLTRPPPPMDPRRLQRTVIDPKVRQVGFVTPAAAPTEYAPSAFIDAADLAAAGDLSSASLSPVMIPPPRHNSAPLPVPLSPHRRDLSNLHFHVVGSYSPSDTPFLAADGGSEFSDDASVTTTAATSWAGARGVPGGGKVAAASACSLPRGNSGEMMSAAMKSPVAPPPRSSFTTAAVVKTVPGLSEKNGGAVLEMQNEGTGTSRPLKQKTTKADRRAIQEAQRATKAAAKEAGGKHSAASSTSRQGKAVKQSSQKKDATHVTATVPASEKKLADRLPEKERKKDVPPPRMQFDDKHRVEKAKRRAVVNQFEARNRVELFRHLPQYVHGTQLPDLESKFFQLDPMHPSVYKVGLKYLSGDISGGNARCIAMLLAFREAIKDYTTPPEKLFIRDLTAKISSYVSFFTECRPLSISMGNAIKFLKNRIAKLPDSLSDSEKKSNLQLEIDHFINEKIVLADKVIVKHAVTKIRDGDVLLTYGSSTVVEMILLHAHELGKQFRVVIVDSRPKFEGQALLRRLVSREISCTYTHINVISYVMHEVSRVFLGASSVLSNGTVYSRVGTACVAMVAHAFHVPVLVCCEAYKFHERVQLDSICSNELGDPDVISKVRGRKDLKNLDNWADNENLQLLNLTYDATPSDYVSMIVTDYGMLPPTSVPVIVRELRREHFWM
ncbi:translation initiation factor eIF-2B subunit delta-like [Iris pallida]|uniref:Translation initiation factor eIF2B subunit delta n=1 Tax=Iris pallida TaxID=29817 RepID=A0AAX6DT14_IRIPA|nr:translation initiation factor eIF-2B subunit delta-like [Iris pallida]KAJ6850311.1 translation initiation factor eIF-2B subunit delta-like [Iris pallida]